MNNFQRRGSISNAHVGRDFEDIAYSYFLQSEGTKLQRNLPVEIGVGSKKKIRKFDLGSHDPAILVECKSHRWTETGNMPSAKVTVWNESMFYFHLAPDHYRKVLFVLGHLHLRTQETLAQYYVRLHAHLIPSGLSIVEYDEDSHATREVNLP